MSSVYGTFPAAPNTIVVNPNNTSVAVTGIKRGVLYRVVATVASNLQIGQAAAANTGMYLPPNVPQEFMFGMGDSQGTDLKVFVFAATSSFVYFTPITRVAG